MEDLRGWLAHMRSRGLVCEVRDADPHIDPGNLEQVMWAICTRTDPAESIEFIRHSWGMALDPMTDFGEGDRLDALPMSRAIINACQPYRRRAEGRFPAAVTVPPEVAARVTEKYPQVLTDRAVAPSWQT